MLQYNYAMKNNMDLPPSLLDASWRDDGDVSCEDMDCQLNLNSHARSTTNSSPATKSSNKLDTFFIATNIIFMFILIFVWINTPCHEYEGHDTSLYDISMNKPDMSTQFEDTISLLRAFEQPGMFITRSKGIWQVMLETDDGNINEIKRYETMPSLEQASEFIKEERLRRASVDKSK